MRRKKKRRTADADFPRKIRSDRFDSSLTTEQVREILAMFDSKGYSEIQKFLRERHGISVGFGTLHRFRVRHLVPQAAPEDGRKPMAGPLPSENGLEDVLRDIDGTDEKHIAAAIYSLQKAIALREQPGFGFPMIHASLRDAAKHCEAARQFWTLEAVEKRKRAFAPIQQSA